MTASDNIPLLTDIIQLGDAEMKNHFDGHVFDDDEKHNIEEDIEESVEEEKDAEEAPIPEIKLHHETDAELDGLQLNLLNNDLDDLDIVMSSFDETIKAEDDFEAVEAVEATNNIKIAEFNNDINLPETKLNNITRDELNEMVTLLVSDAVDSTLPMIEAQLKQRISEQILQKLSRQLD